MTNLTKSETKLATKSLRVVAIVATRRGISETIVAEGTVGWVVGHRKDTNEYLIMWDRPRDYPSDNRSSSHPVADVKAVGRGIAG